MIRVPPGAPILTAADMRAAEEVAFASGIAQIDLMERAGRAVAHHAHRFAGGRPILVLAGPGNNGGDAYVAARYLKEWGHDVLLSPLPAGEGPGVGASAASRARWTGETTPLDLVQPRAFLIDGLFGTGITRPLAPDIATHLSRLTAAAEFTLAIDLPSGTDTDTGDLLDSPAHATATVALGALKPAHVLHPASHRCGHILLADLDIPLPTRWTSVQRPNLTRPAPNAHKYTRGMVAVVAGAMPGAASLAANAALHGGAGYVVVTGDAPATPHAIVHRDLDILDDLRLHCAVVGPGLGRNHPGLSRALATTHALVLDGDALVQLPSRNATTYLTPHEGEFTRLFGKGPGSKIDRTLTAARQTGAVIIHKGPDTVIASPDGRVTVAATGSPWLSTAGTGDVLAGLLAARHGPDPFEAANEAVWLHARAAALAGPAFAADDLIPTIPHAIAECL